MSDRYLELDSEFRNRYRLYHMADGSVRDSRLINWRRIDWDRVIKIELFMHNMTYTFGIEEPGFQFFLNMKSYEYNPQTKKDGKVIKDCRRSVSWINGWSDGKTAHLTEVDGKTCQVIRKYTKPLKDMESHVHPNCKHMVKI